MSPVKKDPQFAWQDDLCPVCNEPPRQCTGGRRKIRKCRNGHQWSWIDGKPVVIEPPKPLKEETHAKPVIAAKPAAGAVKAKEESTDK